MVEADSYHVCLLFMLHFWLVINCIMFAAHCVYGQKRFVHTAHMPASLSALSKTLSQLGLIIPGIPSSLIGKPDREA